MNRAHKYIYIYATSSNEGVSGVKACAEEYIVYALTRGENNTDSTAQNTHTNSKQCHTVYMYSETCPKDHLYRKTTCL